MNARMRSYKQSICTVPFVSANSPQWLDADQAFISVLFRIADPVLHRVCANKSARKSKQTDVVRWLKIGYRQIQPFDFLNEIIDVFLFYRFGEK